MWLNQAGRRAVAKMALRAALTFCMSAAAVPAAVPDLPRSSLPGDLCSEFSWRMIVDSVGLVDTQSRRSCRPLTPASRDAAKAQTFDARSIRVLSAHMVDANGRKHDGIIVQRPRTDGTSGWDVGFPNLAIGDTYEIETSVRANVGDVQRGVVLSYPSSASLGRFSVEVEAPAGFVQVESADFGKANYRKSGDRETWVWNATNLPELKPDSAVSAEDLRPRVAVSFDRDFTATMREAARHYEQAELASVRMRSVAASIAKPGDSKRKKAAAALAWIQRNISYTDAPEFVDETLLPGAVDVTIERRKGMCRDLVAAYGSLLRALDVRAEPVSLNNKSYWQPGIPVTQRQAHIITYLPELDLFVDPSDSGWPLGMWSFQLDQRRGFNLTQLDWMDIRFDPAWESESDEADIFIDASGKGRGTTRLHFVGLLADAERSSIAKVVAANALHERAAMLLKWAGIKGQGTVQPVDPHERKRFGYDVVYTFDGSPYLATTSPVPLPRSPSWKNFGLKLLVSEKFSHSTCLPDQLEQRLTIHWPADLQIARAPQDMRLANAAGEYRSSYVATGALLTITRSFKTRWAKPICTAVDAEALALLETFIAQDRAQTVSLASQKR